MVIYIQYNIYIYKCYTSDNDDERSCLLLGNHMSLRTAILRYLYFYLLFILRILVGENWIQCQDLPESKFALLWMLFVY